MSSAETKIITCPECGHENEVKIFRTVNVTTDAELHDLVISGELFRFRCQNCNHEAELKYPVLYNDMKHKFMVYYIPEIDRASVIDEKLEAEYSKYGELEGITRRLVGTFNELKEKIHIFESDLDDRAMEIAKVALYDVVCKRTGEEVKGGYFSKYSESEKSIGFTFFIGENNEHLVQTTRLEIYKKSIEIAGDYDKDTNRSFLLVDRNWARNALYRYKKKN